MTTDSCCFPQATCQYTPSHRRLFVVSLCEGRLLCAVLHLVYVLRVESCVVLWEVGCWVCFSRVFSFCRPACSRHLLLPVACPCLSSITHHRVLFFFFSFFAHFHFPASGQAVVTGVIPSPPRFLPSIFIAHRVQQSHCSSIVHRALLTHALALSASQFGHKKKSQRIYTSMHSAGLELTKLTYTRLEDNLIRHRGDRLFYSTSSRPIGGAGLLRAAAGSCRQKTAELDRIGVGSHYQLLGFSKLTRII